MEEKKAKEIISLIGNLSDEEALEKLKNITLFDKVWIISVDTYIVNGSLIDTYIATGCLPDSDRSMLILGVFKEEPSESEIKKCAEDASVNVEDVNVESFPLKE